MNDPVEYSYRPKVGVLLLAVVFFGAISCDMYQKALTNNRGLIIDYIFRLDAHEASVFYGVIAALTAGFVGLGILGLAGCAFTSGVLRLTDSAMEIPQGIFQKIRIVPYGEIQQMKVFRIGKQLMLVVTTGDGKINIGASLLPEGKFEEVCRTIAGRVRPGPAGHGTV